ncbi:MAG: TonB-dependent receptor [Parvibaculaceae bacterium]|nr:TonB-dependent receptor [Parvibaculaceae bacterium]
MTSRASASSLELHKALHRKKNEFLIGTAAALVLALGSAQPVFADELSAASSTDPVEEMIVTGTRVKNTTAEDSTSPISVISADELLSTGKSNLREALANVDPSFKAATGFTGQTGIAVRRAALRGLSADHTLILVNGKRRHGSANINTAGVASVGSTSADLDLIPTSGVERVEILRDGAAAQYGSDAIAGVINIILKNNDHGGSADVTVGRYWDDGHKKNGYGPSLQAGVNQGVKIGDGGFLSLSSNYTLQGYTNVAGYVPGNMYPLINGKPDPREATSNRYRQIMGNPRVQNVTLGYNAEIPFADQETKLYSFATAAHRRSSGWGTYRTPVSQQNPYEIFPEGFAPQFVVVDYDYQVVVGVKGKTGNAWGGINWDLSTSVGHDNANVRNEDSTNPSFGSLSPRNLDNGNLKALEWVSDLDLSRPVDTGLFDAPLNVAGGLEFRYNSFKEQAGEYFSWADGGYIIQTGPNAGQKAPPGSAGMAGFAPQDAGSYSRHNIGAYLEFDQDLTKKWNASLAGRYENYSDSGHTFTGKLSSRYQLIDQVAVRGTVSNGFHAPSLQQQFYSSTLPAYGVNAYTGVSGIQITRYIQSTAPAAVALGGKALKPEKSKNVSFGFVFDLLKNWNTTVDAYQIDIKDRILPIGVNVAYATPILTPLGLNQDYSYQFYANAANTRTRGIDITSTYTTDYADWGVVRWNLQSAFNWQKVRKATFSSPQLSALNYSAFGRSTIGNIEVAYPRNITSVEANWKLYPFIVDLKETYYAKARGLNDVTPVRDQVVDPAFITDASISYAITDSLTASLGANNLFNKKPRNLPDSLLSTYGFPAVDPAPSFYSPYGTNGGFYYLRASLEW